MTKQKRLTKDEMMAYELVERMKLNASGYIGPSPYWYGWALRDAYLEGCKSNANADQDKAAMRQAADKIAELKRELVDCKESAEVAKRELVAAYQEYDEMIEREKFITKNAEMAFRFAMEKLENSIQFSQPDSIAERAAITMLQGMTPEQVTVWLGAAYERRYEANERALEAMREG